MESLTAPRPSGLAPIAALNDNQRQAPQGSSPPVASPCGGLTGNTVLKYGWGEIGLAISHLT